MQHKRNQDMSFLIIWLLPFIWNLFFIHFTYKFLFPFNWFEWLEWIFSVSWVNPLCTLLSLKREVLTQHK